MGIRSAVRVPIAAALGLVAALYAGASSQPEATAVAGKPVELSVMFSEQAGADLNSDWPFFKSLQEATGVKLNVIPVPTADYGTKFNVTVASGDMPDMMLCGLNNATVYGLQGAFIRLDQLIEKYAPYTKKGLEQYGTYHLLADSGELYWFPCFQPPNLGDPRLPGYVLMYRTDVAASRGLKEPADLQGWYTMWKAIKTADPATIPLIVGYGAGMLYEYFAGAWGFNTHSDNLGWHWIKDGNKLRDARIHPQLKEMLSYLRRLYAEGLVDAEVFTRTKASWQELTIAGKSFSTVMTGNRALWFTEQAKAAGGSPDYRMFIARDPTGPYGRAGTWSGPYTTADGMVITVKCKNPVAAVRLLDYSISPEGTNLNYWGRQGVDYTLVNGAPMWTDAARAVVKSAAVSKWGGPAHWPYGPKALYPDLNGEKMNKEFYFDPMSRNLADARLQIPELKFTNAENEERQKIRTATSTAFNEWAAKFMSGKADVQTDWNAYVAEMKKLDIEKLETIYSDAYQRYLTWSGGK